jgi:hypothetical protein
MLLDVSSMDFSRVIASQPLIPLQGNRLEAAVQPAVNNDSVSHRAVGVALIALSPFDEPAASCAAWAGFLLSSLGDSVTRAGS